MVHPQRGARSQRHRESRRLEHRRRRRLLREVRSERRELRVRGVAERQRLAREPRDARADDRAGPAAGAAVAARLQAQGSAGARRHAALRFNWDTPIEVSHFDPRVVYIGAQMVFRSADNGATWTAISPDLTTGIDPATLPIMGAPVPPDALSRNDGTSPFASLTSIGESPLDAQVIYAGAQDGIGAAHARRRQDVDELSSKNFPACRSTPTAAPCCRRATRAGRVYATFDGHYSDDYKPYVYVSDDYGQTWRAIVCGPAVDRRQPHPRASERSRTSSCLATSGACTFRPTTAGRGRRSRSSRTFRRCRPTIW